MQINKLIIKGFRNLEDTEIEFPDSGYVIVGDNGQGKTNFLEAVNYLTILRSFRGSTDSECITFGSDCFYLNLSFDDGIVKSEISAGFDKSRKKITLDGKTLGSLSEGFGRFKSIVVCPDDIDMVQQGPSLRRKYLDIVLSVLSPQYLENLKRYRRALDSRNRLIKENVYDDSLLSPWEQQMAEVGSRVTWQRLDYVEQLSPEYEGLFENLSNGETGQVSYVNSVGEGFSSADEYKLRFLELLQAKRQEEFRRGRSLSGPHADELEFVIDDKSLRRFGSTGQQRTAVISLRIAEARLLEKITGQKAVLLLDDIFAELDNSRSENLFAQLAGSHQSLITTPKRENIFLSLSHMPQLAMKNGRLKEIGSDEHQNQKA